ncbi:sterol desaturase family protein [uncultured Thermanaerothrix sp.]|uniref:sterol desaturase family protein n=1 Tax=uncultured Thermanaerothrix sp. TaxID=1195149 RepID=UPI002636B4D1|nr:sterol desaturase family protein [uncultured Thermanaerothrix sp.]
MHRPISHDPQPIRLFKSDFLEFFTHIHPAVVVIIWLPVALIFLGYGVFEATSRTTWFQIPLGFGLGLFLWSLAEYTLHRFVFHFRPRTPFQERVIFLFHGIHHAQPQCKTRLVMPPIVSIPLAFIFYGLFWLILSQLFSAPHWLGPTFAGFITGYLSYDLIHYATHHFPMRRGIWKALKRHHMQHHYKTPDQRFGVSSPLWDYIFGTQGKEKGRDNTSPLHG